MTPGARIAVAAMIVALPLRTAEALEPVVVDGPAAPAQGIVEIVLEDLGDDSTGRSERTQAELDALRSFYRRPGAKPLWVNEQGVTQAARAVAAEIARADDYGLSAADIELPPLYAGAPSPKDLGRAEVGLSRAVLTYARHAKGGRSKLGKLGAQLTEQPRLPEPGAVLEAVAASDDRAAYLRSLHPQHPQFQALREKLVTLRKDKARRAEAKLPDGPVLRRGSAHDHVVLLRKRLGAAAAPADAKAKRFDEGVETAVKRFQRENGLTVDGIVGPGTRRALNADSAEKQILRLLINMERWRWLPDDLDGEAGIHVWANIPEFRVRVVKRGKVAFDERAIVGKVDKQTPVFSDIMEWIEIHPTWYVPNSIKVADILPSLRRSNRVMTRYHLRLDCGRHGRNPEKINWDEVNIRNCSVSQPPGEKSVLGDFKFKFPNKHAVYMHDTLTRRLFSAGIRTFSHGCIRIKNPRRMTEILLAHDKGITSERIGEILEGPRRLHKEEFERPVPVHITYFTALFDPDGNFVTRPDYYGHDSRLADALTGKGHLLPIAQVPGRRKRVRKRRASREQQWWQQDYMQN